MPQSKFIEYAEKFHRFLLHSIIDVDEYASNLLSLCVLEPEVDDETARIVAAGVPAIARERLVAEIKMVLSPDWAFPPTPPATEEERQRYESRTKACAAALARALRS